MSLIRSFRLIRPIRAITPLRYNSSIAKDGKFSLTAEVFPVTKDTITETDIDEWLKAVRSLKANANVETETQVYLNTLTNPEPFVQTTFEPTTEQLAQVEAFADKGIPLQQDEIVKSLTNYIMRHGKKTKAEKVVSNALYIIYLKIRLNPIQVLHTTLDKLGPLISTRTQLTGTAKNKVVPVPLTKKQRDRFAFKWILDASKNKKSPDFSVRLAEEIISAFEGKSAGYDKKAQMHKIGMSNRANLKL